jgi:hypothetical protein
MIAYGQADDDGNGPAQYTHLAKKLDDNTIHVPSKAELFGSAFSLKDWRRQCQSSEQYY